MKNIEHELDAEHRRTGRTRKRQFICYPCPKRPLAPIKVWSWA